MQKPNLKLLLAVGLALVVLLGLSRHLWKKHRLLQNADSEIAVLCQLVLDPEADLEVRCMSANRLRSFTEPAASGSPRMRGLAQLAEGAHILAYSTGLGGELLGGQLADAERLLTLANHSSDPQVAEAAGKGLALLPQLRGGKSPMAPDDVFDSLGTRRLVPPNHGGHPVADVDATLAIQNQDSRKYADDREIKAEESSGLSSLPTFNGGGAKLLFEGLDKQFGFRFKPVSELPRRHRYVPALRGFGLFESKEQPLTGLSGDAVTQDDALLQIALRIKLPGSGREQDAAALALFNQSLKYLEEAKSSQFLEWFAQKERVALMEPDHPFYAQTTVDATLITFRYRPGEAGVSRASFSADFEEKSYFQWLVSELPVDVPRPGK